MSQWSNVIARKALGQHFLHDEHVLGRIAELATPQQDSGLLEIGPGTGNLTAHLLDHGRPLVAVERDRRLPPLLEQRFGDRIEVVRADAARVDYERLLRHPKLGPSPVVVGNLPYNVGTEILMRVMQSPEPPLRMVFMLQREVAMRLVASPSTSAYGLLTVKVGIRADVKAALRVRPGSFSPPPRVQSVVVVVQPLPSMRYDIVSYDNLCVLLNAGFGLRRKTLANALRSRLGIQGDVVREGLAEIGLDARSRAEALSIEQWAKISTHLDSHIPVAKTSRQARRSRRS